MAVAGHMKIRSYPLGQYNFPAAVREIMAVPDLGDLDRYFPVPENPASDQDSAAHAWFYGSFGKLRGLYRLFLREQILPLYDRDLCVQRQPTFRVARPGSLAVSAFHTDAEYAHQPETVNFWVPLTPARGTAAMWIESGPGKGDYAPAEVNPGQFLEFSATTLRHGNKPNDTGRTRVSFDFRVIPLGAYRDDGLATVNRGVPLRLGSYYMLLGADGAFREDQEAACLT